MRFKGSWNRRCGGLLIVRSLPVFSASLGVSGEGDVVEFHETPDGIALKGQSGLWQPYPVEYKRGEFRTDTGDTLQLCAQAMCLEHMLCCKIERGALFYGMPRRRMEITFTDELRKEVLEAIAEMHDMYSRGYTPKVKPTKSCAACSLNELCLPSLMKKRSVGAYIRAAMEEIT